MVQITVKVLSVRTTRAVQYVKCFFTFISSHIIAYKRHISMKFSKINSFYGFIKELLGEISIGITASMCNKYCYSLISLS